ncbi:hypothetical protein GGS24DRAFT_22511 [Hypoxylon argillaceum]|nr:hypothetical protein GGS24DRAFT_22511 [Hypoxylon argillaceum]
MFICILSFATLLSDVGTHLLHILKVHNMSEHLPSLGKYLPGSLSAYAEHVLMATSLRTSIISDAKDARHLTWSCIYVIS